MRLEVGRVLGDPWLNRWLPLVRERSYGCVVLELGCGTGRDTATLTRAGHRVVAVDISLASIVAAKVRVPTAQFYRQDILEPFPVVEAGARAIVASLSLHYFSWAKTLELVGRVRQTLQPKSVLLCRLNSTKDRNFGAVGHERLDENFYLVDGQPKRFFDKESVYNLFAAGWKVLSIEEAIINRYLFPKSVWEVILERDA